MRRGSRASVFAGEKIIIVSGRLPTLNAVEKLAGQHHRIFRLDGRSSVVQRGQVVGDFQQHAGPCVFLLCGAARSLGLTLTASAHLLLCEPHWNPTWDMEAAGRICRPGQTKTCYVVRLFTAATVEEHMFETQGRRREAAQKIQQGSMEDYVSIVPKVPTVKRHLVGTLPSQRDGVACFGVDVLSGEAMEDGADVLPEPADQGEGLELLGWTCCLSRPWRMAELERTCCLSQLRSGFGVRASGCESE